MWDWSTARQVVSHHQALNIAIQCHTPSCSTPRRSLYIAHSKNKSHQGSSLHLNEFITYFIFPPTQRKKKKTKNHTWSHCYRRKSLTPSLYLSLFTLNNNLGKFLIVFCKWKVKSSLTKRLKTSSICERLSRHLNEVKIDKFFCSCSGKGQHLLQTIRKYHNRLKLRCRGSVASTRAHTF